MRRYPTTKLLAVATSAALAREHPGVQVLAFDPGVLPDTGLAREHPAVARAAYGSAVQHHAEPPGSPPGRSARGQHDATRRDHVRSAPQGTPGG
jgi:hypothetical protein